MSPQKMTMSPGYLAAVRGLRELHHLTAQGRQDSPEADAVRDAMDGPWEALTDVEKRRLSGLSEDLYSITDPAPAVVKEPNPQVQARLIDVSEARQRGEWDRVLELLRRWGDYLEPSLLSYLRGDAWHEAGDSATAAIFLKHATDLKPYEGTYVNLCLVVENQTNPSKAQERVKKILQNPARFAPFVVVYASSIVLEHVKELPVGEALQLLRQLVSPLQSTLIQVEKGDDGGIDNATLSMAYYLLGSCHEHLGENQAAIVWFSKGLTTNPRDHALRIARGILLYGESPRS